VHRIIALLIATVIMFPITGLAQTRKRTTTTKSTRSTAPRKASEIQREAAGRVAERIKNLTQFIYVLGGVAKGLEGVDDAARRNEASPAIMQQTQRYKQQVRTSIQTLRETMDKLEIDFRTTPELQRYYIGLAGVAEGAATRRRLRRGK